MRGKREYEHSGRETNRITPADAGKTDTTVPAVRQYTDHPRGCGENAPYSGMTAIQSGSPPRMRGKLLLLVLLPFSAGITPADAGKTLSGLLQSLLNGDHPRGCGENYANICQ